MVTFAQVIESALKRRTEVELATALNCSQQTVSDYRMGKCLPRSRAIGAYAQALRLNERRLRTLIDADRAERMPKEAPSHV